jgi:hypothetical protein
VHHQFLNKKIIPKYARNKFPRTSPAVTNTQKKMQFRHIKDEIRFTYKKKQYLNLELYRTHLKAAQEWKGIWHLLSSQIHAAINAGANHKYKTIYDKLDKLICQQINLLNPTSYVIHHQFNIQQLYALHTLCLCVLYLRTNSDFCHLHKKLIDFYNRDEKRLQRGTDWVFK